MIDQRVCVCVRARVSRKQVKYYRSERISDIGVCVRVRVRALALESRLSIIDHRGLISNIGIMILMQSVVCVCVCV
jgi:hypothetical protein